MNATFRLLACAPLALLASSAWAQCEGTWDNGRIGKTLGDVDKALTEADLVGAKKGLKELDRGWPCLEELASGEDLALYGRLMGLLAFYEQDEMSAVKWGRMAMALDPDGPFPGGLPEGHPYPSLLAEEEAPSKARAEGWLNPPEKGSVFLSGEFAAEPETWTEVPVFVQLFDRNVYPVDSFWQDGNAFRSSLLVDEGEPIEPPKGYDAETGELKVGNKPAKVKLEKVKVEKTPSNFPVVPVATAGGLAAVSGLSYALAGAASSGLPNAQTEADLTRSRSTTNALVLVSAVTGAGAVGVGLGTVLVHSNGVSFHFRF